MSRASRWIFSPSKLNCSDRVAVCLSTGIWFQPSGESHRGSESNHAAVILHVLDAALLRTVGRTDIVLLYLTLLADCIIPGGFLAEFLSLESTMRRSSERRFRITANLSDAEAARLLAAEKRKELHEKLGSSSVLDQLVVAPHIKPPQFRTKWQKHSTKVRPRGRTRSQPNAVVGLICWRMC